MSPRPDSTLLIERIERQVMDGLQPGAQLYVSLKGEPLIDIAVGRSDGSRALRDDDVMLWYSSGKPVTSVAVLQLWERRKLDLDDRVERYLPGFAAGKEAATIRHLLIHTGGFPMYADDPFDRDVSDEEAMALIAAHPAEWEPGTKAGYHPTVSWKVLGALVERIDGRSIDQYLAEEIFLVSGMADTHLSIDQATWASLGERIVPVHWTGHALPARTDDGQIGLVEYHIERIHNEPWHAAKVEPGAGMRGPAHDLGRFYESLLGFNRPLLERRTVEVMIATHRIGMPDAMFGGFKVPWGLGVQVGAAFVGGVGRRAFGHIGMASSCGLADPDLGLVVVLVANGLADPVRVEQRLCELVDGAYSMLGPHASRFRLDWRSAVAA
jgi:CubicO group peptidase (beta-lactamase class C family)